MKRQSQGCQGDTVLPPRLLGDLGRTLGRGAVGCKMGRLKLEAAPCPSLGQVFPEGPPHSQITGTVMRHPGAVLLGLLLTLGVQHVPLPQFIATFPQTTALRSCLARCQIACGQLAITNPYRSPHMCMCIYVYIYLPNNTHMHVHICTHDGSASLTEFWRILAQTCSGTHKWLMLKGESWQVNRMKNILLRNHDC